jgi:acetylxylan esterase
MQNHGCQDRMPYPLFHFLILYFLLILGVDWSVAASLQQITNFGTNPSNIKMYLYVPDKVVAHPPILVGLHWCHGTAQAFHSGTQFATLADKYGFIVIYPNANSSDSCWDVHSKAALSHDGGSDPSGIISMVKYVIQNNNADSSRVYVTGQSSGGMMTNVMLGSYPNIFKAGAAFAGVPFSCFSGTNSWNSDCAGGKITKTPAAWGDLVRAAYPGYTGQRPRMQIWHGTTDAILNFNNFDEAIKQWTNVHGVSQTATTTETNTPQSTWTRTRYTNSSGAVMVEAIREQGQPHNLQILADKAIAFFGLDGSATGVNEAKKNGDSKNSLKEITYARRKLEPNRYIFKIPTLTGQKATINGALVGSDKTNVP